MAGACSSACGGLCSIDLQWHKSKWDVVALCDGWRRWRFGQFCGRMAVDHLDDDRLRHPDANALSDAVTYRYSDGSANGITFADSYCDTVS